MMCLVKKTTVIAVYSGFDDKESFKRRFNYLHGSKKPYGSVQGSKVATRTEKISFIVDLLIYLIHQVNIICRAGNGIGFEIYLPGSSPRR